MRWGKQSTPHVQQQAGHQALRSEGAGPVRPAHCDTLTYDIPEHRCMRQLNVYGCTVCTS